MISTGNTGQDDRLPVGRVAVGLRTGQLAVDEEARPAALRRQQDELARSAHGRRHAGQVALVAGSLPAGAELAQAGGEAALGAAEVAELRRELPLAAEGAVTLRPRMNSVRALVGPELQPCECDG